MTTQAKHTPGPLQLIKHDSIPDCYELADSRGYERKTVAVGVTGANAARLAHCWNNHDSLLEALQACITYLEANRPKGNVKDIFTQLNQYENEVMKPARAAIQSATFNQ